MRATVAVVRNCSRYGSATTGEGSMIIWRGKGILVLLIAILGFMVGTGLAVGIAGVFGMAAEQTARFGPSFGLLIGAVGNFYFARYLDDPAKHRTLVDPRTNQTFVFKDNSSLMFIPVRFWTYILIVFACLTLVLGLVGKVPQAPTRKAAVETPARCEPGYAAPSSLTRSLTSFCSAT